jgi:agmatinase
MRFQLTILLVSIANTLALLIDDQEVLQSHERPPNFIQNSIYAREPVQLDTSHESLTVPPVYHPVGVEDFRNFEGIVTFAHLPYAECTASSANATFDIGIVGHPFDLGVSYRPGARFGPNGARQGARRLDATAGYEYVISRDQPSLASLKADTPI